MVKEHDLSQKNDYDRVIEKFGGEDCLKKDFPLLYEAMQNSRTHFRVTPFSEDVGEDSKALIGRQDILRANILESFEPDAPTVTFNTFCSYLENRPCVIVDNTITDESGKIYGVNTYIYEDVITESITEDLDSIVNNRVYNLHGRSDITSFSLDKTGNPKVDSYTTVEDSISITESGITLVESADVLDPINKYPDKIAQTYIVYGNREDSYVSYYYRNVRNPETIGKRKYAEIWCPFKIKVKLNGNFKFFHAEPLSNSDFSICLEPSEPDVYGGGGIVFNNDFKEIKTILSENDTVLTIEIPEDWRAKLTINDLNCVIGTFNFRACFKINYIAGDQTRMTTVLAATGLNHNGATTGVDALKIRWGCLGRKCILQTPEGKKPINEIVAGDCILAPGGAYVKVTDLTKGYERSIINIQIEGYEDVLQLTEAHAIQTGRGLIAASGLQFEDEIMSAAGTLRQITYLARDEYEDEVFNIETEGHSLFVASNMIVSDKEASAVRPMNKEETPKLPSEFMQELRRWAEQKNR